jgi:phosphoglycerate dehydrogenase-like enzyme
MAEEGSTFLQALGRAEVMFMRPFPFDLSRAPRLRWIQLASAGLNRLLGHPIMDSDVIVTTTSGIHATPIAEYALASMLAFFRRFPEMWGAQRQREWPANVWHFAGQELRGKTVGIVGYGSIGQEVARLCHAFGMRILATKRRLDQQRPNRFSIAGLGDPEAAFVDAWFSRMDMAALLRECDVVVICVPLTAETRGMIGAPELRAMKSTAYLLNVSRGAVLDEPALLQALKEGWIAGAGLDTTVEEPLPADSELWDMENVILTPHISALTPQLRVRGVELFCENLRRYLKGLPMLNVVDKEVGY